jgi:uracil-DNA glycosylase family 4
MEDAAEQLEVLARSVGECALCGELVACRLRAVPGGGHPHCAVMVVSLCPDTDEEEERRAAGSVRLARLAEVMPALATGGDRVYVTTLVKCVPRSGSAVRSPRPQEADNCFPFLSKELSITTPHYILTVGDETTRFVLGKLFKDAPYKKGDSLELRVFDNPAFKVVPVAEPDELRERDEEARREYARRLHALARVMGLLELDRA